MIDSTNARKWTMPAGGSPARCLIEDKPVRGMEATAERWLGVPLKPRERTTPAISTTLHYCASHPS